MRERTPDIEGSSEDSDSRCDRYGGSAASPVARMTRNAQCSSQSSRPIEARVVENELLLLLRDHRLRPPSIGDDVAEEEIDEHARQGERERKDILVAGGKIFVEARV